MKSTEFVMADHGNPALERAIRILDALAETPGAGIKDLSVRLGIPRSTVYRLLNTLLENGFVTPSGEQGFALGVRILRLAGAVQAGADLVELARPSMAELARNLGCTVKLSVLDNDMALVVGIAEGPQNYSIGTRIGRRFPLHAGAASKVLASHLDPDRKRRLFNTQLEKLTDQTVTDPVALDRNFEQILEAGFARDNGEHAAGICAVAVPLFGPGGSCLAALSIPFLNGLPEVTIDSYTEALAATAAEIGRKMGFVA